MFSNVKVGDFKYSPFIFVTILFTFLYKPEVSSLEFISAALLSLLIGWIASDVV